jgi:hypothetical protein
MAYSGNLSNDNFDEDSSISSVRKAHDLVIFVKSSVIATEKIRSFQASYGSASCILKLLSNVKTRWWSIHTHW